MNASEPTAFDHRAASPPIAWPIGHPDERELLVRLAYRFCWNRSDADDAVQSALILAAQRAEQLENPAKRRAWLKTIVVKQCLELNRRKRDATLDAAPHDANRREPLEHAELGELLRCQIQRLPGRQQAVIVLRHLEGMEYPQIAELLEIAESTVRVLARNAREALRTAIVSRHPEWAGG